MQIDFHVDYRCITQAAQIGQASSFTLWVPVEGQEIKWKNEWIRKLPVATKAIPELGRCFVVYSVVHEGLISVQDLAFVA